MQPQETNSRTAGALKHPDAAEWMAFLYAEVAPKRRGELEDHLARCVDCSAQMETWRADVAALGEWRLPAMRRTSSAAPWAARPWWPALKWAAVAVMVLGLGFTVGRQTSPSAAEFAALKTSMAQLADAVQRDREAGPSNTVSVATAAANAEAVRLLSEYAQAQTEGRRAEQQAVTLALRNFETRLVRLRAELETVALNTEDGFEQTHENLTRLVSFSAPPEKSTIK